MPLHRPLKQPLPPGDRQRRSRARRALALLLPLSWLLGRAGPTGAQTTAQTAASTAPSLSAELRSRRLRPEGIHIDLPPLADSGNAVPITVEVDAPQGLTIRSIEVLLPENPFPPAIKFNLPQAQPRYRFSTRLRLAASQEAWVIVTLSDGSQRGASAPTVITSSACFDET